MISPERSHELLRTYAATRCGTAFRELVAGWTGMVHATALRVSRGQETLAEDVAQAVFSRLAAAPEKVRDGRALGAWLHAAATGLTLDALRLEARRRRREEASQNLIMPTLETPAADAGDDRHELMPEIDGALSRLPPQDSQLLLMRFWQRQDWRSIGRNFGLSDDAAQKRMNRALERLRRILAGRGITSSAGALSAVLAGMVPADLPAAAVLKIISATQACTATGAASAVLTTVAMTTKTKLTLAASAALLLAATVPMVHQRQRIADLRRENESLRQASLIPALKKTPAAVLAGEGGSARAIPARPRNLPDPPSPEISGISGPAMEKTGHPDFDAMNRGKLKEKLAVLGKRLSLTPEQETAIAEALEYGQSGIKIAPPNVIVTKASPEEVKKMEDAINASLTAGQQKEYAAFREEEKANALEAVANRELSNLQSMTTLSQEQKDQAFAAFSEIASRESTLPVLEPGGEREAQAIQEAVEARWADRREALSAILTPEQMAIYQQAGSGYKRGGGG
ncbi:MAG: sigma-70 family RNA polymerase sigma factor [Verrucomicrobiota bacterium]